MKLFFSDRYDLHIGDHVFPVQKYPLTVKRLLEGKVFAPEEIVEPKPASDEEVLLVHTQEYVRKLKKGKLSYEEILRLEVPYSKDLVDAVWRAAGGTVAACEAALSDRIAANVGGGFHHAFADHGEGFCVLNDVAVGIRTMQKEEKIRTAMTIDCDVHHGNGTADIFRHDPTVFTLSIHQENNYPYPKPPSSLDLHLPDRADDALYLRELKRGLDDAFHDFTPDLVLYVAGADPYQFDQLGGLSLTMEGLKKRDELVLKTAWLHHVPVAIVLAGGYAYRLDDTVAIHANTLKTAKDVFQNNG